MADLTNEELTTAAIFAESLTARGLTFDDLKVAINDDGLLDELVGAFRLHRTITGRTHRLIPIETLAFSDRRVANTLMREGIEYLTELAFYTSDDILVIPTLGVSSLEFVKMALAEHGLSLRWPTQSPDMIAERVYGTSDKEIVGRLLGRDPATSRIWKE